MLTVRKAAERGHADHGWLNTYHTFSFADYYDPQQMGFRALRVVNEDRVQPGKGFGTHGHKDMEIISYVLEGALEHRDSLGNGSVLRPGELQRMTAGTGVLHSEFNPSATEPVHFYQIWLLPSTRGLKPGYEQRAFEDARKHGRLLPVATADGRDGSLQVNQDVDVFLAMLAERQPLTHVLQSGRHAWLQVLRGSVEVNGSVLEESDGVAISNEPSLQLRRRNAARGAEPAEVMLFDLE